MSLLVGLTTSPNAGLDVGINGHVGIPIDGDATSGIKRPSSAAQWEQVFRNAGLSAQSPSHLWLCQDTSTTLAGTIGGVSLLENSTGHQYQQSVSGWASKFVGVGSEVSNVYWYTFSASLPDISATSCIAIAYIAITAEVVTAPRTLYGLGTGANIEARLALSTTTKLRAQSGSNNSTGTADFGVNTVRPVVLAVNIAAGTSKVYSDLEKLTPTHGTLSGKQFTFPGITTARCLSNMFAIFQGAATELNDTQIKAVINALGWNVSW